SSLIEEDSLRVAFGCIFQCPSLLWGFLPPKGVGGLGSKKQKDQVSFLMASCGWPWTSTAFRWLFFYSGMHVAV
ncbi:Os04g0477550, partial [Oryza sativa Japonica Group]